MIKTRKGSTPEPIQTEMAEYNANGGGGDGQSGGPSNGTRQRQQQMNSNKSSYNTAISGYSTQSGNITTTRRNSSDTELTEVTEQTLSASAASPVNPAMSGNSEHFPTAVPMEQCMGQHIVNSMGQIATKSPLYNVSRPVSVREYDATSPSENLYPFGASNSSVALDAHTPLPIVSRIQSKGLLSPTSQFQMMTHSLMHRGGPRLRFKDNDLKYKSISEENGEDEAMRQSLELRRNMSRSLDVRLEDSEHTPYTPDRREQRGAQRLGREHDVDAFSPLPSRRRTQKLQAVPMALDAANCKKSKSLLIRADRGDRGDRGKCKRLKTRTFDHLHGDGNGQNMDHRLTVDCQGAVRAARRGSAGHFNPRQSVSNTPPIRSRRKEAILPMHRSNSIHSLSVQTKHFEDENGGDRRNRGQDAVSVIEDEGDSDGSERDREDETNMMERGISREDIASGDELSVEDFPAFVDRDRRRTIEMNSPPIPE